MTGRYDLALGLIPTALVGSLVVSVTTDLRLVRTLVPAALVGIAVIADVCYLNPPVDEE
ncbi:hypothetical protein [Natronococcus wangiae]|uniref:hypothetical protein n=1 Tax=Natronococcus wangiae TaxID=3068275 RepID=UPI00273DD9E5|nr:hypothetical protein [Natronococcus sp. AD5]